MRQRRIAAIGVHGVSAIEEGSTLEAISDMLHRLRDADGTPIYSSHTETETILGVEPLAINPMVNDTVGDTNGGEPGLFSFDERQKFLTFYRTDTEGAHRLTPSHGLMRDLLRNFDPRNVKDHPLRCHRMARRGGPDGDDRQVDLYEMYWDDLSRLSAGFVGVFGDLYHILFHLSHIGQQTVDLAAGRNRKAERDRHRGDRVKAWAIALFWDAYMAINTLTGRILTIGVPLLNVLLLAIISVLLPLSIQDDTQRRILAVAAPPLAAMLALGFFYWRRTQDKAVHTVPVLLGTFALWLILGVTVGALLLFLTDSPVRLVRTLACEWHLLAFAFYIWGMWAFNVRRPGAFLVSLLTGLPALGFVLWSDATSDGTPEAVIRGALNVCEAVYVLLFLVWMAFSVTFLLTNVIGLASWAGRGKPTGDADEVAAELTEREKTRRSYWTAVISLAVPAAAFLGLTLAVWMALVLTTTTLLPHQRTAAPADKAPVMEYRSVILAQQGVLGLRLMPEKFTRPQPADEFMKTLVYTSATTGFPVGVGMFAISFLLVGYIFFPSALAEVKPPAGQDAMMLSRPMGQWLSDGYRSMVTSGGLFALMMGLIMPGYALWDAWRNGHTTSDAEYEVTRYVLGWFGSALAAAAVTVTGLRLRFEKVSQSFRPIVEVILDVDNHLRSLPTRNTPRARIAARYASLLRYLCQQGYDAIVIAAHSQGSVITADLLLFLQQESERLRSGFLEQGAGVGPWEPHLQPIIAGDIPIYFLTFGCPLRQLYSLRFPHLYSWARFNEDDTPPYRPHPGDLKVVRWVNLYHSGDYVGRCLWHDEQELASWDPEAVPRAVGAADRQEACIGAGAHIRYWDSSSPQVAAALDRLIAEAEPPEWI